MIGGVARDPRTTREEEEKNIELHRAWTPEDMTLDECGICGHEFRLGSVMASARTDRNEDMGNACPECVGYFGGRNPAKCATAAEHREALARFPRPMFASREELEAAVEEPGAYDPSDLAYERSWVWQAAVS